MHVDACEPRCPGEMVRNQKIFIPKKNMKLKYLKKFGPISLINVFGKILNKCGNQVRRFLGRFSLSSQNCNPIGGAVPPFRAVREILYISR